jgi:hypothetical protein
MSSPAITVNQAMAWLNEHFGFRIPTLPFASWLTTLASFWEKYIVGPLPPPDEPMPFCIPIEGEWPPDGLPGTKIVLRNLRIAVGVQGRGSPPC